MLPPDNHVHSEYSYDARRTGAMERTCERAVAVGLPAVAFTEHVDFTEWGEGDAIPETTPEITRSMIEPFDVDGYQASVQRCRERFPELRVLTGIETGEPHLFKGGVARVLKAATFDRVLGSLHSVEYEGRLVDAGWLVNALPPDEAMRRYFAELVRLVDGSDVFQVLAHADFPRRYWPWGNRPYQESDFEEEYRTVFRALAGSDRALEVNTKSPLFSVELVRWWHEEGGGAVSFGSDTHAPGRVGDKFELATDIAEAAGFRPGRDRYDFWRR